MKFPRKFNCGYCDQEHVSNFMAAFILDTAGNWYFDLGEEKGWVVVDDKQYEKLTKLFKQRTQLLCDKHSQEIVVDPKSGERIFSEKA
jgi:hypothetical protein